jgi:hypothetical protein
MVSHTATLQVPKRELKKQVVLATGFDSFPENSQTSPDACFVTNLRLPITQNYDFGRIGSR